MTDHFIYVVYNKNGQIANSLTLATYDQVKQMHNNYPDHAYDLFSITNPDVNLTIN
jgi:hypothetical protein